MIVEISPASQYLILDYRMHHGSLPLGWLLLSLATSSRGVLVAAGHDVRIQASGSLANPSPGVFRVLDVVVIVGTLVSWTTWLAIQVPTYRRATGVHRQQLKWLYSGAAIFVFAHFGVFIAALAVKAIPGWASESVTNVLAILGTAALPACLGGGGTEVPAVRAQPRHQPGGLLLADHGPARRGVRRPGAPGHPRTAGHQPPTCQSGSPAPG